MHRMRVSGVWLGMDGGCVECQVFVGDPTGRRDCRVFVQGVAMDDDASRPPSAGAAVSFPLR